MSAAGWLVAGVAQLPWLLALAYLAWSGRLAECRAWDRAAAERTPRWRLDVGRSAWRDPRFPRETVTSADWADGDAA